MSQLQPSPGATPVSTPTGTNSASVGTSLPISSFTESPSTANTTSISVTPSISSPVLDSGSLNQTNISFPINSPAGGIVMTKPLQSAVSFYKIASNEIVTFGWSFTNILQNPDKLTVSAICDNGNTYPVGPKDGIISGTATEVAWDLYSWQVNNPGMPLAQGTYTITMWDDRGKSAVPMPGLMRQYNNLRFELYTPQPYISLEDGELLNLR